MRKIKLSKTGKIIIAGIFILIISTFWGLKLYKNYLYKQTYEYKLLEKGYNLNDVKKLKKLYNIKRLNYILKIEKNNNLIALATANYFIDSKLEEYLSYIAENNTDPTTTIRKINTYTNYNFYDHDIPATNYSDTIIANKYYLLKEEYVPENLVKISNSYGWGTDNQATEKTLNAFIQMQQACKEETGITLMINSSYRSYNDQKEVYEYYQKLYDIDYADSIAARPGHSEHQTGLALDIFSYTDRIQKTFSEGKTYDWLKDNSYKYGFIVRYPENKEDITGFNFESWHYRYVGKDIAKTIYENDLTYEEYYAYYIENNE